MQTRTRLTALAALGLAFAAPEAAADGFAGTAYPARDLLNICQEADNASRMIGQIAETECEQYMTGFVDALFLAGGTGPEAGICPPQVNTADEMRWAFAKWVHASWTERTAMSAGDAIMGTLRDSFACPTE